MRCLLIFSIKLTLFLWNDDFSEKAVGILIYDCGFDKKSVFILLLKRFSLLKYHESRLIPGTFEFWLLQESFDNFFRLASIFKSFVFGAPCISVSFAKRASSREFCQVSFIYHKYIQIYVWRVWWRLMTETFYSRHFGILSVWELQIRKLH